MSFIVELFFSLSNLERASTTAFFFYNGFLMRKLFFYSLVLPVSLLPFRRSLFDCSCNAEVLSFDAVRSVSLLFDYWCLLRMKARMEAPLHCDLSERVMFDLMFSYDCSEV